MTGFPELRHDRLTDRRVLVAPGRARRPATARAEVPKSESGSPCPFCPGNEGATPPEVMRTGEGRPDTPGWEIRVVPNLYPFVGGPDAGPGATGVHEVVVISPDHDRAFEALSVDQVVEVLTVLRARARTWSEHAHVQPLVNQGQAAGASIAHPHAQLIALDFVPPEVERAVERFSATRTDLVIADIDESHDQGLDVMADGVARAWCSSAAASPFEVRVSPLDAGPDFAGASDEQVRDVATGLRSVIDGVVTILDGPAYNVVFHTAPRDTTYHWWLEVVPRISVNAGFELATGVHVNVVDPTVAAATLRQHLGTA